MPHVPTGCIALILTVCLAWIAPAPPAFALDQPISATRIILQRKNGKETLSFQSKDPAFLFPAIGSSDFPTGTGMLVELLSATEGRFYEYIVPQPGTPGWTSKATPIAQHQFKNPDAPDQLSTFKKVLLRQGKQIKIDGKAALLPLAAPSTRIAIRIRTDDLTNCAVFTLANVKKNEANRFIAVHASAAGLVDCSDNALLGIPNICTNGNFPTCNGECPAGETCVGDGFSEDCKCIAPTMPCGDTNPTCNGTCPAGEECVSFGIDEPYNHCGCLPAGSTPCGTPNAPICGGACPGGGPCTAVFIPYEIGGGMDCDCIGFSCGNGFAWGGAPQEGFPYDCYPIICDGTYPTCGGPCLDGGVCDPFAFGSFENCICRAP